MLSNIEKSVATTQKQRNDICSKFGPNRRKSAISRSGGGPGRKIVDFVDSAEIFVTTKSHYSRRPSAVRRAERDGVMVHVLRRGTKEQIRQFLKRFAQDQIHAEKFEPNNFEEHKHNGRSREALRETEDAITRVISGEQRVELMSQPPYVRRMQHSLAARNNLGSASMGREPSRRVVIRRRKR